MKSKKAYRKHVVMGGGKSSFLFLIFFLMTYVALTGQVTQTDQIDPGIGPNPDTKPGYNLIFRDEFSTTIQNDQTWHFSDIHEVGATCAEYDDHPENYGDDESEQHNFLTTIYPAPNPADVTSSNGDAKIYVKNENFNTCDHSGGEIKTVDIEEGAPYRNWQLLPDSYLEIRAKLPYLTGKNIGSAGWLFAEWTSPEWRELDIWETYGDKKDRFQNNYHSGITNETSVDNPCKVKIQDLQGDRVNIDEQYLIFGVEWTDNQIRFYLNNVFIRSINLSAANPAKLPPLPFTLRMGAGRALSVEPNLLTGESAFLLVDYVRLYKKNTVLATVPHGVPVSQMCSNGSGYIGVWYVKGAQYTWSSSSFDLTTAGWQYCFCDEVMITPKPNIALNTTHYVTVEVDYPTGYTELKSFPVFVGSIASAPTDISAAQYQSTCDYKLTASGGTYGLPCEWSVDGSQWSSSTGNVFCCVDAGSHSVSVRKVSPCGTSPVYTENMNLPFIPGCAHELVDNNTLSKKANITEAERLVTALETEKEIKMKDELLSMRSTLPEAEIDTPVECNIYSISGILVWNGTISDAQMDNISSEILKNAPAGIYVVKLNYPIPVISKVFIGH